jgi:hypothetical protein
MSPGGQRDVAMVSFCQSNDLFSFFFRPSILQWSLLKGDEVLKIPLSPMPHLRRRSSFHFTLLSIARTIFPISLWFSLTQSICCLRISSLSYSLPRSTAASKLPKPLFRLSPVLSSLPQTDLGSGAGISPAFPPLPCSDTLPSASPLSEGERDIREEICLTVLAPRANSGVMDKRMGQSLAENALSSMMTFTHLFFLTNAGVRAMLLYTSAAGLDSFQVIWPTTRGSPYRWWAPMLLSLPTWFHEPL